MRNKERLKNGVTYVVMSLVSITMLLPFIWMLSTSLKEKKDAISLPIRLLPETVTFEAYKNIWDMIPLLDGIKNTMLIVIPVILCGTFVSALAAFAFAKMDMPCKNGLFLGILASMMIPGVINLIPTYVTWGNLGLVDTLIPLIVPGMLGNVSMMFFLRQFLMGVPSEYIEAARIDGAGWMKIFLRIFFPMMRPALAAQIIFWFMGIWNDFLGPLIYLDSEENYTVQLALRLLDTLGRNTSEYPTIMAGSVISCIPLIALYICFQKHFVNAVVVSGIKG